MGVKKSLKVSKPAKSTKLKKEDSLAFIIYGATGDVTHRKIIPGLFLLYKLGQLPKKFMIFAYARRNKTDKIYAQELFESLDNYLNLDSNSKRLWQYFSKHIDYCTCTFYDILGYKKLKKKINVFDKNSKKIFYLATSSVEYTPILENIKNVHLSDKNSRVVAEKPFGHDLKSAKILNKALITCFTEEQIFRMDHYLGKEPVQNIVAFRFSNVIDNLISSKYIDHIQIIADEKIGVEKRGGYYDRTGALKDMVQNHLLQLISLVAMERPKTFSAKDIAYEKSKVISSIKKMTRGEILKNVVYGQYNSGKIDNKKVVAYKDEERIANGSSTETFVALKLFLNNKRWADTPFYVRTGKRLESKTTKIVIYFKENFSTYFKETKAKQNSLEISIYPGTYIKLILNEKSQEMGFKTNPLILTFCKSDRDEIQMQEAYQRLLYDVINGHQLLFSCKGEIEESWKFIDSIVNVLKSTYRRFPNYKSGSKGPREVDNLIVRDKRFWSV